MALGNAKGFNTGGGLVDEEDEYGADTVEDGVDVEDPAPTTDPGLHQRAGVYRVYDAGDAAKEVHDGAPEGAREGGNDLGDGGGGYEDEGDGGAVECL